MLSEVNTWLGFQVNPCGPVVDFPTDKRTTLKALLHTIAAGDSFTAKEIERALGRLNWATAAWPLSRPFLQPFWAWKSATTTSGKPSKLIRSFAKLLLQLLHNPKSSPVHMTQPPTGGVLVMQVHILKTGPILVVGLQTVRIPQRNRPGGSITRYPGRITHGLTKMVIRRDALRPSRCSAL